MRSKFRKTIMNLWLVLCMAFSMFAVSAFAEDLNSTDVVADSTEKIDECETVIKEYSAAKAEKYRAGDNTYPTLDGYLFAGWYTDKECSKDTVLGSKTPTGKTYALFVPEHVLSIKAQVSAKLLDSNIENDTTTSLRFITSVNSLLYKEVGFEVTYVGGDGKTYKAYIYKTNENKDNIAIEEKEVTSKDKLTISLLANDGVTVKITEEEFDYVTDYEKNYVYIEGEKATLSGDAKVSNNAFNDQYASGKKTAEYIGNGADNAVTFTVYAEANGVYELNVFYISGNDRRLMVSVNGDDANRIRTGKLNSGDWVSVYKETIYVELKAGENTIKLYNDEAFAPNIDRISLSKEPVNATITISDEEKDVVENSPCSEYEYVMYEAEKAVVASGATNEGHMVGWLGGNAYVEFNNIEVAADGTYYLEVWYMTGEDRDMYFSINGGENIVLKCPNSGDYNSNPACVYLEVELKAGTNIIKVSNPNGYAPNLDKIGVSVTCK